MAAFANAEGGVIYLGVDDDGVLPGLSRADVVRINQLISNDPGRQLDHPQPDPGVVHRQRIVALSWLGIRHQARVGRLA